MSELNTDINAMREEDLMNDMYLSFNISDDEYAIEIRYVIEIIQLQDIALVPQMPHYMKGIINLRGTIVPVIDMNLRFNNPEREYDDRTCIIVILINEMEIGLIVDFVQDVNSVPQSRISPPPKSRTGYDANYIMGVIRPDEETGESGANVKLLIDCPKLFLSMDVPPME